VCSTFVCLLLVQEFNLANLILSCFQQNKNLFCSVRSMYEYMINEGVPFNNKFIWKPKIPLKIKIFLWYLQRGVILTKDNLTKRNWVGSQKCCFCDCNETIKHLFFNCQHAKHICRVVQIATRLTTPRSVRLMLRNWLTGIAKKD
jgi:hypothetical protein